MAGKIKILCVDDEKINLLILRKILGKDDFEVVTANDGKEALDVLRQHQEDVKLVITDMHMPIMTGLEFVIKAHKQFKNVKYFMLSGYSITPEIQEALDTNLIFNYFEKPPNYKEIVKVLHDNL